VRILVHDYCGHPFQIQLSRALARRGHTVLHIYSNSVQSPHGQLVTHEDLPTFTLTAINLPSSVRKYSLGRRYAQERHYAYLLETECRRFRPDIVLSANTPLFVQKVLQRTTKYINGRFIFWLQDLLGVGIHNMLSQRIPILGALVGAYAIRLEHQLCKNSDAIIAITPDFEMYLRKNNTYLPPITVIPNWSPLDDVPLVPKINPWSLLEGVHDIFTIVYSGTLGLKHNTGMLLELAKRTQLQDDIRIIVVSEGLGADFLREEQQRHNLSHLRVMDYVAFDQLPNILGTADILVAILSAEAGVFSVPSKIMTYHCAGKPMVLAMPSENLASRIVSEYETGMVVPPNDHEGFYQAVMHLYSDTPLRERLGTNARRYAENTFDIASITDRFETVFTSLCQDV
jgi:colanic acid biosynthesis glycosyl transferase WcaI